MTTAPTTDELDPRFGDRLIRPGDRGYDDARRLWNGMIDRRPELIARCRDRDDAVAALRFARRHGYEIAVRSGGHGVAGKAMCDGGVVIDLSLMKAVHVDAEARTARVEPGATWGLVDGATQRFGLAVTGGVDSRTGVAGLTLGGGMGYLGRAHGLTVDNLLSSEVVLADGRIVVASPSELPDLFWALRGGGGNFGIVTSFELRLHEVGPEVMTAQVFHPMDEAAAVLARYRDLMAGAPDEVACYALFVNVPPGDPFPAERQGTTALALVACHAGSLEDGERDLAPLATLGDPFLAAVAPMPYAALQQSFDAGAPDGARFYWKAGFLDDLTDGAIDTLVGGVDPLPGPFSIVFLESMGGAIARVDPTATAFPHRRARFGFGISSGWDDPAADDAAIAWTRRLHEAMGPHYAGGVYANYVDRDEDDRVDEAFATNRARLAEVKASYDPDNLFHLNVNVAPAR